MNPSDDKTTSRRPLPTRAFRAAARVTGLLLLGVVGFVVVVLLAVQITPVATVLGRTLLKLANPWPGTTTSVGSVRGNWLSTLSLTNVRIASSADSLLISIDTLNVAYNLGGLFGNTLHFRSVELARPVVRTRLLADGALVLLHPFAPADTASGDTTEGLRVRGDRLDVVGGEFTLVESSGARDRRLEVTGVELRADSILIAGDILAIIDSLHARARISGGSSEGVTLASAGVIGRDFIQVRSFSVSSARSHIAADGFLPLPLSVSSLLTRADFRLKASPVSYGDLHDLFPGAGPGGEAWVDLDSRNNGDSSYTSLVARFPGGGAVSMKGASRLLVQGSLSVGAECSMTRFSPSGLFGSPDSTESINGTLLLRGSGSAPSDFDGALSLDIVRSHFAGLGPVEGSVSADIRHGDIRGSVHGVARAMMVDARVLTNPFDASPRFDIRGSVTIPRLSDPVPAFERVGGLHAHFELAGHGFDPDSMTGRARVEGVWRGNPYFRSFRIEGDVDRGVVHAAGDFFTSTGSAAFSADAALLGTPSYRIQVPGFQGISLSAFGTDIPPSNLRGSLQAECSGRTLAELTGGATLTLDTSRVAGTDINGLHAVLALTGGTMRLTGGVESSAGSIELRGTAAPFADSPFVRISEMTFGHVDLGRILGIGGMSSDLNGSLSVAASAQSLGDVSLMLHDSLAGTDGSVRLSGLLTLGDSRFNRQAIDSAAIRLSLLDGNIESVIDVRTGSGGLKGTVRGHPFGADPSVSVVGCTVEHIDVGALSGSGGVRTDLNLLLDGSARGAALDRSTGDLSVQILRSSIDSLMLTGGSVRATVNREDFKFNGAVDLQDGQVELTAAGVRTDDGIRGNAELGLTLTENPGRRLADTVRPTGFTMSAALAGSWGAPSTTDIRGVLHGIGSYRGFRVDTMVCVVAVHGRSVVIDTARVASNVLNVAADGRLALFDSAADSGSDCRLAVSVQSLQPLERLLGLPPTLLRQATLAVRANGPPGKTRVHGDISVNAAAVGDIAVTDLGGSADLVLENAGRIDHAEGTVDLSGFRYGSLSLENAVVAIHSVRDTHDIAASLRLDRKSVITVGGSVHAESDSVTVRVDSLFLRGPAGIWSLNRQASIVFGPRLVVNGLGLQSGTRDILINGVLDPNGAEDFTIEGDSLNVSTIGALFGRPELDGLLFLNLRVEGEAEDPRASGKFSLRLRDGAGGLGDLSSTVSLHGHRLSVSGQIDQPEGGTMHVTAHLPFSPAELRGAGARAASAADSVDVHCTADRFNIGFFKPFLSPAAVNSLSGALTADLRVSGRSDSLVTDGVAFLEDGRVGITSLGVAYTGVRIGCTAEGRQVRIDTAEAESGGGAVRLAGSVDLDNPTEPRFHLNLTADKFLVLQTAEIKASITGTAALSGGGGRPTITGDLELNDSYYVIPEAVKSGNVEAVELTPEDYAMLLRYFGYRQPVVKASTGPSTIEPTIDLNLRMHQNTWIRKPLNPTLAIELQGSVRVERQPERPPRITGTLRPVAGRSYVGQFGRQFEVTQGEIVFKGPLSETELRMDSEYEVPSKSGSGLSEVVIRMKVESNLGRFTFSLTSDPAMEESEILSYLATGQSKTGALANTADQGGLAGAMALEQLVGAAGGIAEGSIPVDVFQIRQDGARGITIVAGNYVNRKTYLGIRQPILFSQGTQDSYYDTRTQYELEYEAKSWLFLNLQGGSSRTLLFLKARYAY